MSHSERELEVIRMSRHQRELEAIRMHIIAMQNGFFGCFHCGNSPKEGSSWKQAEAEGWTECRECAAICCCEECLEQHVCEEDEDEEEC